MRGIIDERASLRYFLVNEVEIGTLARRLADRQKNIVCEHGRGDDAATARKRMRSGNLLCVNFHSFDG
jgi:hypothetical protein